MVNSTPERKEQLGVEFHRVGSREKDRGHPKGRREGTKKSVLEGQSFLGFSSLP
jgi:hypothetical protein